LSSGLQPEDLWVLHNICGLLLVRQLQVDRYRCKLQCLPGYGMDLLTRMPAVAAARRVPGHGACFLSEFGEVMLFLIAAVAVVGCLCLLDLLLTFGVIRRLREHTTMLTRVSVMTRPPVIRLSAGELPGAFSAVTTSGDVVHGPVGLAVVAFFSSSCSVCPEQVPPFVEYLSRHRIGLDSVLAVIAGDGEAPPYLAALREVAQVCVESYDGETAKAFSVAGFPTFCVLDPDGTIVASEWEPSALPEPASL